MMWDKMANNIETASESNALRQNHHTTSFFSTTSTGLPGAPRDVSLVVSSNSTLTVRFQPPETVDQPLPDTRVRTSKNMQSCDI